MNDKITNIESDYDVLEWNREKIAPRIKGIKFLFQSIFIYLESLKHIIKENESFSGTEDVLTQIDQQDLKCFNDIAEYAKGPWMTLEEFEISLK